MSKVTINLDSAVRSRFLAQALDVPNKSNLTADVRIMFFHKGFTLIELMVSIALGVFITAGVLTFSINTFKNNADSMKEIHLNQELRALMDVMVRDIRRAGYWRKADGIKKNIYAMDEHALMVSNSNCIIYAYDDYHASDSKADKVQDTDTAGFRLIKNIIKFRKKSSACSSNRNWESLSDNNTIKITTLKFELSQVCQNISNPMASTTEPGCSSSTRSEELLPSASNDIMVTMKVVKITLRGELYADPQVSSADIVTTLVVRNSVVM